MIKKKSGGFSQLVNENGSRSLRYIYTLTSQTDRLCHIALLEWSLKRFRFNLLPCHNTRNDRFYFRFVVSFRTKRLVEEYWVKSPRWFYCTEVSLESIHCWALFGVFEALHSSLPEQIGVF